MKTNIKNRFYVYEQYNIETGEIFYVGKGTGRRLKSPNGRNRYFLRYKNKYNCDVRIVKDNLTNDESLELEAELIAKYKKENQPLTNLTDGGENPPVLSGEKNGMYSKTHTDEVKKKLHDCNIGKHDGEKNHQFGFEQCVYLLLFGETCYLDIFQSLFLIHLTSFLLHLLLLLF